MKTPLKYTFCFIAIILASGLSIWCAHEPRGVDCALGFHLTLVNRSPDTLFCKFSPDSFWNLRLKTMDRDSFILQPLASTTESMYYAWHTRYSCNFICGREVNVSAATTGNPNFFSTTVSFCDKIRPTYWLGFPNYILGGGCNDCHETIWDTLVIDPQY